MSSQPPLRRINPPRASGRAIHSGRARAEINPARSKAVTTQTKDLQIRSPMSNPLIYKQLLTMVNNCEHRQLTDKISNAPCCASEGGKVYRCTLYNVEPAKPYDCLICQRDRAIAQDLPWVRPLLVLSQGSVLPSSSLGQVSQNLSEGLSMPSTKPSSSEKNL